MTVYALVLFGCTGSDDAPSDTAALDSGGIVDTNIEPVWEQKRIESSSTINGIYSSGSGVYAVGTGGFAFLGSSDDPWTYMTIDVDDADLTGLWGTGKDETTVLAATTTTGLVAQYTAGAWSTGTLDDTSTLAAVGGSDAANLFAVGHGRVYHFDGTAWAYEELPNNEQLNDVYASGDVAIGVGDGGDCAKRSGGVWATCDLGVTADINGIAGSDTDDVFAVGAAGLVLRYDGTEWTDLQSPTTETLWGVFVPDKKTAFIVGSNGVALKYDSGEWTDLPTGVDNILYSVHGVSESNLWAAGNRGMALHFKE